MELVLSIENSLIRLVLRPGKEGLPLLQGIIQIPRHGSSTQASLITFLKIGWCGVLPDFPQSFDGRRHSSTLAVNIRLESLEAILLRPPVKIPGSKMRVLCCGTDHNLDETWVRVGSRQSHASKRVAIGAFDLVVGDMFFVHQLRGIFRGQEDRFHYDIRRNFPSGDMAIPLHDAEMALLAGDPPGNILFVIEVPPLDLDISF